MGTVTKKPKGKIKIKERHRTNSIVYRQGDVTDYYSIVERSEGCGCPGTKMEIVKYYQVTGGLIPINKAEIYE